MDYVARIWRTLVGSPEIPYVDMRESFADALVILCIYDNEYARGYLFTSSHWLLPLKSSLTSEFPFVHEFVSMHIGNSCHAELM